MSRSFAYLRAQEREGSRLLEHKQLVRLLVCFLAVMVSVAAGKLHCNEQVPQHLSAQTYVIGVPGSIGEVVLTTAARTCVLTTPELPPSPPPSFTWSKPCSRWKIGKQGSCCCGAVSCRCSERCC